MNYTNGLKALRASLIQSATNREAPEIKPLESFIPARATAEPLTETPEDITSRSASWLSEIKKASSEFKKAYNELASKRPAPNPLYAATTGFLEQKSPKRRPEEIDAIVSEAKAQPLVGKRGERPSRFAPDNAPGRPTQKFGDKETFIKTLYPKAIEVGKQINVDPRIIIAQAALETGWGKSVPSNNFFGIKSHGEEGGVTVNTKEEVNGKLVDVKDSFRAYENPDESFQDYAEFLATNDRYLPMLAANGLEAQLQALGQSGYATDSSYVSKLRSIIKSLPDPKGYS